jgi:hypothetical protein
MSESKARLRMKRRNRLSHHLYSGILA